MPFQSQGSSPLTRGKPGDRASDRLPRRLIPAHAGKTVRFRRLLARSRAHPRSRRENAMYSRARSPSTGSSPLTRGKLIAFDAIASTSRLIPVHAGKIKPKPWNASSTGAHPHSRGENFPDDCVHVGVTGSSPLTQGQRARLSGLGLPLRLIPAHAGKTCFRGVRWLARWAHPHSRAENAPGIASASWFQGSSPLTRGKQSEGTGAFTHHGLIPAHAGKTR